MRPKKPPHPTPDHILRPFLPNRRRTTTLATAIAATAILPLLAPHLTRRFVDDALTGSPTAHLARIAVLYLGVALCAQAARLCTAWLAGRAAWDGGNRLREDLTAHALTLDHTTRTPGELIERVDGDVIAVADFAVAFVLDVLVSALLLVGVVAVVLTVDWRIGALLLGYCLIVGLGMVRAQRLAVPSGNRASQANAALHGFLEERIAGAEDIRANGAGDHSVERFHRASTTLHHAERRGALVGTSIIAGTSVAFALGTALMLGAAAWIGTLSTGTAVLLFQYTLMIRTPFERLIDQLRSFQDALTGLHRIRDLLAERRALPEPAHPRPLPRAGPLAVRLDGVGFAYVHGDHWSLADATLHLAPGETLGLVGRTGSGKTTLTRLVVRLNDPTSGAVHVGGVDLRDADPASLRQRISVITQDVQLFTASLRDNLTLFRPELADDMQLFDALAQVGLADWAAALPAGLDTVVGGGVSAGEAQLLSLARAFLADPGLVVLDEASSRLDPATERRLERSVDRLLAGRTAILVAHRLSSLSRVDRIAVVEDGRIVEQGRRTDLAADPASRFSRLLTLAEAPR